jgi:competence protein ComEC
VVFAIGITSGYWLAEALPMALPLLVLLLALLFVSWILARKQLFSNPFFGITLYSLVFTLGFTGYQMQLPKFQTTHFANTSFLETENFLQIKITEVLKPDLYNNKYIGNIAYLNNQKQSGKLLISIQKDSANRPIKIDNTILISTKIEKIPMAKNPFQFDYKSYMESLGVYYQLKTTYPQILKITKGTPTLIGRAQELRTYVISKLKESPIAERELAIIQALILGDKRDVDKELYAQYAAAGAVHILAVSGLHVGVIFLILQTLLLPLKRFKNGTLIRSILIVFLLWEYAFFTGLSPSVSRAVTMFSFLALAGIFHRKTSTINTLALSFLVLLIYNPLLLFHVGFQLSYAAVLSILLIQPKLSAYYQPRNYFKRLFWGIITVTSAAQLGIIPLSLYYFHQFPGLFFITNIVILPFLALLLSTGVFIVLLASFNILPNWLATSYGSVIKWLNHFVGWIAGQEDFLWREISFSKIKVIAFYLVLFCLWMLWRKFDFKNLAISLISIAILTSSFIWDDYNTSQNTLTIFQKNRKTLITTQNTHHLNIFSNDSIINHIEKYPLKGYYIGNGISQITRSKIPSVFAFGEQNFIVVDSLGLYPKYIERAALILTYSPKINLVRVIDSLQPSILIADGSNYKSYVARWKQTCLNKKIPFHSTYEKGAYAVKIPKK